MIQTKELRIGNYLLDWQKDVVTVHAIERRIACLHRNKVQVPYELEQLYPVFLNEGWFKKFGFELINGAYWSKGGISFEEEEVGHYRPSTGYGLHSFGICIKHVHQLQNLYYTLTGKEL